MEVGQVIDHAETDVIVLVVHFEGCTEAEHQGNEHRFRRPVEVRIFRSDFLAIFIAPSDIAAATQVEGELSTSFNIEEVNRVETEGHRNIEVEDVKI